ncbi:hypothetical protein O6P43_010332 [Quillaja saponaria]|uniref:Uncharacterized protein n=1 Tax=Quillaja saponaria TaxID=32244 RepID=A0AAD7Q087_QUISA|nr:hypothetical protein O6P43_010332 [Quillaja saponaria]
MSSNSVLINLNADFVLYDREIEVHGVNSSEPMINVGVSDGQTLNESLNGKGSDVDGGKATCAFDMNMGSDIAIDRMDKEGANREIEFMEKVNYVEAEIGFLDRGNNVKASDFGDGKKRIEGSEGDQIVTRGADKNEGLILESNNDVQSVGESKGGDKLMERKWDQNGQMSLVDRISDQVAGNSVNLSKAMEYKNKNGTTDVLSFIHGDVEHCALGIADS